MELFVANLKVLYNHAKLSNLLKFHAINDNFQAYCSSLSPSLSLSFSLPLPLSLPLSFSLSRSPSPSLSLSFSLSLHNDLAGPQPILVNDIEGKLLLPDVNHFAFLNFCSKSHQDPHNKVGSPSPVKHRVWFDTGNFQVDFNVLTHQATLLCISCTVIVFVLLCLLFLWLGFSCLKARATYFLKCCGVVLK